ncbi:MAG: hypothetical protein IT423_21190, partial [Pirellulaceae bacterium]|nr:hypothetical protein [Pirellulaceae bacterium]
MSALEPGWVVAVDGGGSKIAIAAMRTDGFDEHSHHLPESLDQARQWHFPGTGSAHPSSWLTAASNLQRGLWTVTSELLQSGLPIHYLLLSLAGAGRPEDRARVLESIRPTLPRPVVTGASVACVGDIDPLVDYHCDTPHINTLAVIVGTGSITAARDPQGQIVRAGGWGPLLGDECSGGVLGLEALRALVRAIDQGLCLDNLPEFLSVILQKVHELSPQSQSSNLNTRLIELAADRTRAATLAGTVLEHAYGSQDLTALQLV